MGTTANIIADISFLPFKERSFTIIRVWHVLEHLHDPVFTLLSLGRLLKDDGFIHIRTPSENYKQLIREIGSLFISTIFVLLHVGFNRSACCSFRNSVAHILLWRRRMMGDKRTSGYGGHKWLIKWGKKTRWRGLFTWQYELTLSLGDFIPNSTIRLGAYTDMEKFR